MSDSKPRSQPYPWLRLYTDIVDDEKLRLLAFEDRWHYVAILCCKRKGMLDSDEPEDLTDRKLAVKLGVQRRELEEIKRRLFEVGLIDDAWHPVAWDKRQYESDISTERVRKYRERKAKSKGGDK